MTKLPILITGASGNVGLELCREFVKRDYSIIIGLRNPDKSNELILSIKENSTLENNSTGSVVVRRFDFQNSDNYTKSLAGVQKVFLVRPPALSNVKRDIFPFLKACHDSKIDQIVFLSLQGAEKLFFVPHRKIELEILRLEIPYTFLRPSFFMQNLSTTHRDEIRAGTLVIPAGTGKTSFIDVRDIAEAAFLSLTQENHINRCYELTSENALNYFEVVDILSAHLGRKIVYSSPSLPYFWLRQYRLHHSMAYATVTTLIYASARWGKAAKISPELGDLLKRRPRSFEEFVRDYRQEFI